jgi:uncharacterized BrkB/YihY/UPF0761 family membrane protein
LADTGRDLWHRDQARAGNVLAAGLAFRFFLCLLPAALFYSAAIGFSTAAELPEVTSGEKLGTVAVLASVLARSSNEAHRDRWELVVLGSILLLYTGWGVARALIVIHSIIWETQARVTLGRSIGATVGVLGIIALTLSGSAVRAQSDQFAWEVSAVLMLFYGVLWLGISLVLPHRDGPFVMLLPGAILIAVGVEAMHILNAFFVAPRLARGSGIYGSLGVVSALMFGLFILARLVVTSPAANHAMWLRRYKQPDAG